MNKSRDKLYIMPILGFILIIMIGAMILKMPICNNKPISFLDSLFISTSGVCITGYTPLVLSEQFNLFGQFILLVLVELGALGFMTIIIFIASLAQKRIKFSDLLLLEDGEVSADLREKTKRIMLYTFIIQGIGAFFLSLRFVPLFGLGKGIWNSIFHSITAFCNSGFDIIGANSFEPFANDVYLNSIMMILIVLGGIGFLVLEDLIKVFKERSLKHLRFQSKIVLITTGIIYIFSIIYFKMMDSNITLLQAMFMAVTLRTAGFSTIKMANCTPAVKMVGTILMFIGGAPGSTAGGIRVVTFAVLVLSILATLRNRKKVVVFYRKINENIIMKSITITGWAFFAIFIAIILMSVFNNFGLQNIIFHCVGSFANVGMGMASSSMLNGVGKIVLMCLMFIGRLGPIVAFRIFFNTTNKETESIQYVDGNLVL